MSILLKWIFVSSKDPKNASLTVLSLLLGAIPWLLKASSIACGVYICTGLTDSALHELFGMTANVVFWIFSAVAGISFIYGFLRKIILTVQGKNKAIE